MSYQIVAHRNFQALATFLLESQHVLRPVMLEVAELWPGHSSGSAASKARVARVAGLADRRYVRYRPTGSAG